MRNYRSRRASSRGQAIGLLLLTAVILTAAVFVHLDGQLRPLLQSYGLQAARRGAMTAVHQGVEEVLAAQETVYSDLVSVTRDDTGRILSAETDISAINRLKSQASLAVTERLSETEDQAVRIPLGSLIGGSFFTGRGPFLPVNIHSGGSVITTLTDSFSDAGVNQTCHRIYLKMTVMVTVLLPGEQQSLTLETEFLLCETVLVGEVPDSFTQLDFGE